MDDCAVANRSRSAAPGRLQVVAVGGVGSEGYSVMGGYDNASARAATAMRISLVGEVSYSIPQQRELPHGTEYVTRARRDQPRRRTADSSMPMGRVPNLKIERMRFDGILDDHQS